MRFFFQVGFLFIWREAKGGRPLAFLSAPARTDHPPCAVPWRSALARAASRRSSRARPGRFPPATSFLRPSARLPLSKKAGPLKVSQSGCALRPAPAFKESGASQGIAVGLRPPPGSKKGAKKKLKKNQKKSVRLLTVFSKSARFSFTALKHGRSSLEQAGKGRER